VWKREWCGRESGVEERVVWKREGSERESLV
jgi:hypothetical protein